MADVEFHGPFFNGGSIAVLGAMSADIAATLAEEGTALVQGELPHVLRNPTPRYQLGIHDEANGNNAKVTDGGIIYGHWLEGTGSRNRTTRFKGYFTFRRMTHILDMRAEGIAERVALPYIGRM